MIPFKFSTAISLSKNQMPNSISQSPQQLSLFRSRIQNRSFDDGTVRILDLILASKDVESSIGIRSALSEFMRDECLLFFREIIEESVEIKLLCTDFLIRVFAIIGDVESCLALRYEALVMRQEKSTSYPELEVSYEEWLTFAEHSLENGFHKIADEACGKALMCSKANYVADAGTNDFVQDMAIIKKIKRLKNAALLSISSRSVQAQTTLYLKQKQVEQRTHRLVTSNETFSSGSSRFRSGIRKRNMRKLRNYQCL